MNLKVGKIYVHKFLTECYFLVLKVDKNKYCLLNHRGKIDYCDLNSGLVCMGNKEL